MTLKAKCMWISSPRLSEERWTYSTCTLQSQSYARTCINSHTYAHTCVCLGWVHAVSTVDVRVERSPFGLPNHLYCWQRLQSNTHGWKGGEKRVSTPARIYCKVSTREKERWKWCRGMGYEISDSCSDVGVPIPFHDTSVLVSSFVAISFKIIACIFI